MRQILDLAWLNVLQIFRDRSELASILILPILLTAIFGLAFGSGGGGEVRVAFTDEDGSAYSRQLGSLLAEEKDAFTLQKEKSADAKALVADGKAAAWVHVPAGFGEAISSGSTGRIEVVRDPSSNRTLAASEIVQGAADRIAVDAKAATVAIAALAATRDAFEGKPLPVGAIVPMPVRDLPAEVRAELAKTFPYLDAEPDFADLYDKADAYWEPKAPVEVVSTAVTPSDVRGDSTQAEGFAQYSLGFTVMFVLFIALGSAGGILEERENGTLQRLLVTPNSKRQILAGKIFGVLFTASLEAAILIVFGTVAFHVPWGRDPLALLMVMGAYVLCATGFALLISSLVRTRGQMSSLGTVLAVALAMLGGAYWPIEVVSPVMRRIADFTFTGWAMFGLVDVVARNQGVAAAIVPTAVLLGFAAVFFAAGAALLKFE